LNSLQQSSFPPFSLQPFHWNFGQTTLDIAATAAPTDRDLSDHEALRFQRTISILVHSVIRPPSGSYLIQQAIQVVHFKRFW
jgi:hypothetical protein